MRKEKNQYLLLKSNLAHPIYQYPAYKILRHNHTFPFLVTPFRCTCTFTSPLNFFGFAYSKNSSREALHFRTPALARFSKIIFFSFQLKKKMIELLLDVENNKTVLYNFKKASNSI